MASTHDLLTDDIVAKESLMLLRNNLVMGSKVHRAYEGEFGMAGENVKKGDTIRIRKPNKFTVTTGRTRSTSTISERSTTLQVAYQKHVSWAFNSKDLTLTINRYSEEYVTPAAAVLANEIDSDVLALYDDVWNSVAQTDTTGTGFITPNTFTVMGDAQVLLDEEAAPQDSRCMVVNPRTNWAMANAFKNMFVTDVSAGALKKGYLGRIANLEVYMDQNVRTHTTGAFHDTGSTAAIHAGLSGGTGIPTGAVEDTTNKTLSMINFRVVNTEVLKVGDSFTVAGVFAVNPMSGDSTGQLRHFTVTAAASCGATETTSGNAVSVFFEPPMVNTGPYKTVDTVPAAAAAVTVFGTQGEPYPQNLVFHKNAFALVFVPLVVPDSVSWGSTATEDGYSCRVVKDYNVDSDDEIVRLDVLYGVKTLYPELAVRMFGAEG